MCVYDIYIYIYICVCVYISVCVCADMPVTHPTNPLSALAAQVTIDPPRSRVLGKLDDRPEMGSVLAKSVEQWAPQPPAQPKPSEKRGCEMV